MNEAEIYDKLAEDVTDEVREFVAKVSRKYPLLGAPEVKVEELPNGQRVTLSLDFAVTEQAVADA